MSGGIQEKIRLNKNSDDFHKAKIWSIISKAINKKALMGCSIDVIFHNRIFFKIKYFSIKIAGSKYC